MLALDVEFRNFAVVLDARNLIFKNGSTGPQGSELAADPAKGLKNRQFGIEFLHQSDGFRGSRLNALMLATGVCGRLLQTLTSEGLPQNRWAEWRTRRSSSDSQRARVLTAVKARRSAPPPLRGAHGLDAGSAHGRPGSCLTMTQS